MKSVLAKRMEDFGTLTSGIRILPTFLVVGAQRSGTSSLYEYLVNHPAVGRSLVEEVHYFDWNYDRGVRWYRGHFPTNVRAAYLKARSSTEPITGEATPYYMFHPLAPKRIASDLPNAKLFVVLRNPVDRAYSHHQHERAMGFETLSFEDALEQEPLRLQGEVEKILQDPAYRGFNHQHYSYFSRGVYVDQLENLYSLFPQDQILVATSDELAKEPASVYAKAIDFLGLPPHSLPKFPKHNTGKYTPMDPTTRERLTARFAEANERLYGLLETRPLWED